MVITKREGVTKVSVSLPADVLWDSRRTNPKGGGALVVNLNLIIQYCNHPDDHIQTS